MEYKYYLAQLNKEETVLYSFIYTKIKELADSFKVNASSEVVQRIIKAIMMDNPELFWFEGKWKAVYGVDGILIFPKYKKMSNINEISNEINNSVENTLECCQGSDIMRIMKVYDWLLENVQYCHTDNDQTIEGVFGDKKAVCKGIAKAFQICMNKLNIPSFLIEGTLDGKVSHAWNVVFINEKFYHVDVTTGYQLFSNMFKNEGRNKHYPCFMISDRTISKTHRMYLENYPCCLDDFDLNGFLVKQFNIPDKFLQYGKVEYLDKGSTCTVFKISGRDSNYALKIIDSINDNSKYTKACMELEKLQILSENKCVMKLKDSVVEQQKGRVYMLFKFYKTLSERRKESDFDKEKDVLMLGVDLLNAMIECREKGIYHLDIQPKNIYFDCNNRAILGDFGNSMYDYELEDLRGGIGTIAFMAPEVYIEGKYGQASEIYSLGIVLYSFMNNAKLPFAETNDSHTGIVRRLNGENLPIPIGCKETIWQCFSKMCAFDITKRYSTYEDARDALLTTLNVINEA